MISYASISSRDTARAGTWLIMLLSGSVFTSCDGGNLVSLNTYITESGSRLTITTVNQPR